MGCVYSSPTHRTIFRRSKSKRSVLNHNNNNNRIFSVINVDDQGNEINHGQIEITDADLILHQRGKNSIFWSLRSLRRYGFDSELFSFECGRRCPTGPGIYAFKCRQAEQLFNVLQESIQRCSNTSLPPSLLANLPNHITSPQHLSGLVSISSTSVAPDPGPRISMPRINNPPHLYANNVHEYTNAPCYVNTLKSSSLSSESMMSPLSNGPPVRLSNNIDFMSGTTDVNTNYAKFDDLMRYYVNINTPTSQPQSHKVSNTSRNSTSFDNQSSSSLPNSPTPVETTQPPPPEEPVNYVTLDLYPTASCSSPTYVTTAPATPISKTPKNGELNFNQCNPVTSLSCNGGPLTPRQYATIDFDKTVALSNSAVNHRKN
ncbi:fibroblast growth factor receptor substrate 3-like protein [Dinothrombium tinctorium]|uniref:Fibroblast growth factor receptor substrate 3-like protein n=1 Tax=Dinothrombium tinctorium TaxID=1965070 RepID=A0A443QY88_9ACAR|nr:fibroblast growth factor receptor substrate 3-like protein [Dinothrombium tinctorium]